MAKRKTRRSRRSRRGLGCMGCGPAGQATLTGFGFMDDARPGFKYALYAVGAYFLYTRFLKPGAPGMAGLGAIFTPPANGADSLNRPAMPGQVIEIPRGF